MSSFLSEFVDGGPLCGRDDCMVREMGGSQTAMYFPPIYNAQGANINPDNNTKTLNKKCLSCGRAWTETIQNGFKSSRT